MIDTLNAEDIKLEIYSAVKDGIKEYLESQGDEFFDIIADKLRDSIDINLTVNKRDSR